MDRANIFRDFLNKNNFYMDYNGEHYTLVNKEQTAIHISNTNNEMYNFILGFNLSMRISDETIMNLTEINRINVERYEKIISDMVSENENKNN
jgi:hypothetical protein